MQTEACGQLLVSPTRCIQLSKRRHLNRTIPSSPSTSRYNDFRFKVQLFEKAKAKIDLRLPVSPRMVRAWRAGGVGGGGGGQEIGLDGVRKGSPRVDCAISQFGTMLGCWVIEMIRLAKCLPGVSMDGYHPSR